MYILREHYKKKLHQEITSEEQTYAARNNVQIKALEILKQVPKKLESWLPFSLTFSLAHTGEQDS